MTTIRALQSISMQRAATWHEAALRDWSVAEWTNALAGEAGEACNIAKKILRHDLGMIGNVSNPTKDTRAELVDKLGCELADTVLYAVITAGHIGLDLQDYIVKVFNEKSDLLGFKEHI